MKRHVTRTGVQIGGWFPKGLADAVDRWVDSHPERDRSMILREAVRDKLSREGIPFDERADSTTTTATIA